MTETNTAETVTVELDVESAYQQLVAHEEAFAAFSKAQEEGDKDASLEAAIAGVEAAITLINDVIPPEVSEKLHERLQREHPELVQEDPLAALLAQLFGPAAEGE